MRSLSRCLAFILTLSALLLPAVNAQAQFGTDCNRLSALDERCGVFSRADLILVEEAAEKLRAVGAEIRVRGICNFGGYANLDLWEDAAEKACASWRAPGGTKNNLVVLAVSFGESRGAGLYYGDEYAAALRPIWTRILTQEMVPRLKAGNTQGGKHAEAFIIALEKIREAIVRQQQGAVAPVKPSVPPESPAPPTATTPVQPNAGTGNSGLWLGLIVVFGLGALTGAVLLIVWLVRSAKKREQAQEDAKRKRTDCSDAVTELKTTVDQTELDVTAATAGLPTEETAGLIALVDKLKRTYGEAANEYGKLLTALDMDPFFSKHPTAKYKEIAAAYGAVSIKLDRIRKQAAEVAAELDEARRRAKIAPAAVQEAKDELRSNEDRIKAVEAAGYRVDRETVETPLTAARDAAAQAETLLGEKRFRACLDQVKLAKESSAKAAETAEDLPKLRQRTDEGITTARQRLAETDQRLDQAHLIFTAMAAEFNPISWEAVAGSGTEAEERLTTATERLNEATEGNTLAAQKFEEAASQLTEAGELVDIAKQRAESIFEMSERLNAAKREAAPEVAAAQADIDQARDYIARFDPDIDDSLEDDLDRDQLELNQTREMLNADKPDYVTALRAARAANQTADNILKTATEQHERMERLRQRLEAALREAQRSIETADSYICRNPCDSGTGPRSLLGEAENLLRSARSENQLERALELAEQADHQADAAYAKAKHNVSEAEDERERRRRATAAAAAASIRRSSGGFGGSSSGGGRGGGSISIGGGRGGGSVGW